MLKKPLAITGLIFLMMFVLLPCLSAEPVRLQYKYRQGDRYRILSSIQQNVFVDGRFSHSSHLLNRLHITIDQVENSDEGQRGFILLDYEAGETVDFQPGIYHLRDRYRSEFWRDARGIYEIESQYFVPVVRDVPVWPDKTIEPGDTWTYEGYEVHDFRQPFGIQEPYRFPAPAQYRYLGLQEFEGKTLDAVEISYTVFYRSPSRPQQIYPSLVTGSAVQIMYFDRELGRPEFYQEEYDLELRMNSGQTYRFAGTAEARVLASYSLDRQEVEADIERELAERQVADASVEQDERGVTIRLSNIEFPPDSAELLPSEQEKVRQIGEILLKYPDQDVLVTGHTALAGSAEGRQQLSEERAAVVGRYLIKLGVRDADRLVFRGLGATVPRADNSTEQGRAQNRRVEITILED